MYEYVMNISMANKKLTISDELMNAIIVACKDANETSNSKRYGRSFKFIKRLDDFTIQIVLQSEDTPVINASRSVSSITRALLRTYDKKDDLNDAVYCGSILNATIVEEKIPPKADVVTSLQPNEVIEEIFKIFYSQSKMGATQRKKAKLAAKQLEQVVIEYLQ